MEMKYDDRIDLTGKTVEIVDAGKPTSFKVGYGVAEGTPDDELQVIRVQREGAKEIILVNFGLHPDGIGGTKFCADWPGFMRIALKEKYGEDVTVLFFNGCCGDVNHPDFLHRCCCRCCLHRRYCCHYQRCGHFCIAWKLC